MFAMGLTILFGRLLLTSFNTELGDNSTTPLSPVGLQILQDNNERYTPVFQSVFVIVWIGLFLATIVSAFFIRTHPVFFVVGIFILAIYTLMNAIYSDIYGEVIATEELAAAGTQMSVITYVMQYFPFFMIFFAVIVVIVLYSKISPGDF